jgi:hypothetical protein
MPAPRRRDRRTASVGWKGFDDLGRPTSFMCTFVRGRPSPPPRPVGRWRQATTHLARLLIAGRWLATGQRARDRPSAAQARSVQRTQPPRVHRAPRLQRPTRRSSPGPRHLDRAYGCSASHRLTTDPPRTVSRSGMAPGPPLLGPGGVTTTWPTAAQPVRRSGPLSSGSASTRWLMPVM